MTKDVAKPDIPCLDGMPQDEDGPVFSAPWEAKVFAMVYGLCEQGRYEWNDVQTYLVDEISAGEARARDSGGSRRLTTRVSLPPA